MARLNPVLAALPPYPFSRLRATVDELRARGVEILDFGMGEPREETPSFIREALAAEPLAPYPVTGGLPELRAAITRWIARRFGVEVEAAIPTLGTKEVIFSMASVVDGAIAVPTPAYPVYERGALFAGREVVGLPLTAENGFLPDLEAVPWDRIGLLWLNYPNNPTAAVAPLAFYEQAAALARKHDVVLCSDEAYSEIYFGDEPPASVLQAGDLRNVLALNTLSKRSAMPGYRSGFAAGDPALVAALERFRPNTGTVPQEFVQRVSVLAWEDEEHVEAMRAIYRAKREVLLPACRAAGLEHVGGDATMFLWLRDPAGVTARLLDRGVVLAPGDFFGDAGRGYARLALVPPLAVCERAASVIGMEGGVQAAP
ncbi:MAG: N-succinyldiaminopimelate aminotransferase [Solirubrobacteraceae bacterium]|nr:N-succinyldiaminopimelate aminotransferase [Solirubrobacteraceae bacterium]